MRRVGHTYRLHDWGPFTVAFFSNWRCDGSHRWPRVDLVFRDRWFAGRSCTGGRALRYRRLSIPMPYVKWGFAYRHPYLMPANRAFDNLYRKVSN